MLFKLVSGQNPFDLNPGLLAIAEYKDLTDRQMFFVCLSADADWDNPLRTLPEKQRREKAALIAGYPLEADGKRPDKNARMLIGGKIESVEKAIAFYRATQFDEDKANLAAIDHQVQEARDLMALDKQKAAQGDIELAFVLAEKAVKLGQGIARLVETRRELKALVQAKEPIKLEITTYTAADLPSEEEDQGDQEESTIDKVMRLKGGANDQVE